MSFLREMAQRIRETFRPRRTDRDLQDELESHLEMAAADTRRRGGTPDDAKRVAVVRVGDVAPAMDALRDQRGVSWVSDAIRDVRYACRGLMRARGLAVVAVTSLALGIGANAVIFSIVDAALLRPLPYRDADRLVELLQTVQTLGGDRGQVMMRAGRIEDLRALSQVFEGVSAYSGPTSLALAEGAESSLSVGALAPGLPAFLGVSPRLGRVFTQDDVDAGDAVVISDAYWQRGFSRDPDVIGASIAFTSGTRTVVGVMPPSFRYFVGARTDAWLPIADRAGEQVVARLRSGLSVEQAQRELDAALANPEMTWRPLGIEILAADWNRAGGYFSRGARTQGTQVMMFSLLGAVGLLLAIGCANVANLLLSRTLARQREIAVRRSLGASRWRVARQFLTEGIVVAGLGSAAAVVLAWWGIRALPAIVPADLVYSVFGVTAPQLDVRVLAFGCLVSVITGLLCGSTSAIRAFTAGVSDGVLAGGGQRVAGSSLVQRRVHGALQVVQVAMTVVLLAGAGLLLTSVYRMAAVPPGYDPENLGYASLSFPRTWTARAGVTQRRAFLDELVTRLKAVPGISSVTVGPAPVGVYSNGEFLPEDVGPDMPADLRALVSPVRADYFQVAGIPLVSGRTFNADDAPGAPPVAIINESTARRFWPDGTAIGRRFKQFAGDDIELPSTIVGVVRDVRTIGPTQDYVQIYRPSTQAFESSYILFRASGDMAPVITTIRNMAREIDSGVAMTEAGTVDSLYAERSPIGAARFYAVFIGLFAGIALLTAAIGLYGVLSYSVSRRTHEIGVRMALGASTARVRWMMAGEVLGPVMVGVAAGVTAALWLSQFIASQLFQVAPRDPVILSTIVLLLIAASAVAAIVPVRRAARIEPASALRAE